MQVRDDDMKFPWGSWSGREWSKNEEANYGAGRVGPTRTHSHLPRQVMRSWWAPFTFTFLITFDWFGVCFNQTLVPPAYSGLPFGIFDSSFMPILKHKVTCNIYVIIYIIIIYVLNCLLIFFFMDLEILAYENVTMWPFLFWDNATYALSGRLLSP